MTTPISPKVVAATAWAFLAPLLLAALLALVSYLMTDDGRALFAAVPTWVQVPLLAFISALSAALAGYRKRDALRDIGQDAILDGQVQLAAHEGTVYPTADPEPVDVNGDGRDDKTGRFI